MNISKIPNNSLIIIPNNLKIKILKKLNNHPLKNIKVMTINEVFQKFYFKFDDRAIYYLMKKYEFVYDVAKMYLDRMYEVKITSSKSPKIKKIIDLKKELQEEKLLIYSPNFIEYLKTKKVIFINCRYLDKLEQKLLEDISKITQTEIINEDNEEYNHKYIYEFTTIDEEVNYVATSICDLLKKGINLNQIKLCGVNGEYPSIIKRIFKWYHIPITFSDNFLYSTSPAKFFLENLDETGVNALKLLEENFDLTKPKSLEIYNKIISILNKYAWCDSYIEIKSLLENDFKQTIISIEHYDEEVEVLSDLTTKSDDDHVFLLGFNQGEIPKTYKDESYFNDSLKEELGLETTNELNQRISNKWLDSIKKTKNLTITMKLTSQSGEHYLSNLNDYLSLEIKRPKIEYNYSNLYNKLILGEKIDTLLKYGEITNDLELLYSNYQDIKYREYNNDYTPINKQKLEKYLNNNLTLSYSAMNTYYQCSFRYYLANILKLNIYEETFYTVLGNLFHYILQISFKQEINLEKEYNKFLSNCNYNFNKRELFFLKKLQKDLEFIINTIKKQNEKTSLNKTFFEEKITVDKSKNNFQIIFKGFIDKLIANEEEDTIAIIDYKTGNPDLNLNNIIYGLDLQLPVYIYLAKQKFKNAFVSGFYLQKILNNEITKDHKHTYEELKEEKLKLQGYSNSNIAILEKFDSSYNESKVIKGMRTTSKGLGTKKVLNNEQIDTLAKITEEKINNAIDNIIDANFKINPKRVGMNNLGCQYCDFKDICFFNEKNIENLKEYKNMEFLGGDFDDTQETN